MPYLASLKKIASVGFKHKSQETTAEELTDKDTPKAQFDLNKITVGDFFLL